MKKKTRRPVGLHVAARKCFALGRVVPVDVE